MVKDLNDPTNRDTVPAMLTPGEYVVNKEATQMYGPLIHAMNQHGLQERHADNVRHLNQGGLSAKISKLHGEGYNAPGQAYAIAKSMGYNQGGLVDFIKQEEGFRTKAYQDPGGVWTIGYGRTTNPDGSRIRPGQTTSRDAEDAWVQQRVAKERAAVAEYGKANGYNWTQGQIDALASFRYNGGQGMLNTLTGKGTRTNDEIAAKIPAYNKQRINGNLTELPGLTKRRNRELSMFTGQSAPAAEVPVPQSAPPQPQQQQPTQVAQADVEQTATPAPQQEAEKPSLGSMLGQAALMGLTAGPAAPIMHQVSRAYTQLAPQSKMKMPATTMKDEDKMQPRYFNNGGWLSALFGNDDDQQKMANALAGRPGSRNLDPLSGILPQPNVPTAVPTGVNLSPMGQEAARMAVDAFAPPPANQAPPQMPQPPGVPPNVPVPGSDEAILQGSSDAQDTSVMGGWDQLTPDQFMQEAQPKGVTGGSADPTGQSLQTVGAPDLYQPLSPEQQQSYDSLPERAAATNAPSFTEAARPTPTSVENAPVVDKTAPTPEKKATVETKVNEVVQAEEPFVPEGGQESIAQAGEAAVRAEPAQQASAMDKIKGFFGDLFDSDELKRAAVLYLGALATGASPGQSLAIAGKSYLGRIDAKEASEAKHMNDLVKGGKYTPASIKAYRESGDPSDLTPVPDGKNAIMAGTGQFQEFYSPSGKRVNAEKVKVGEGQYIWMGSDGQQISSKWETDPSRVQGTQEYTQRVSKDSGEYTEMLKGLRGTFGTEQTRNGNVYATDIVPEVGGREIARWAIENNVDPAVMGELVQNAYQAAIEDSSGKKVKSLTPYLNDLYVKATVGDADLFKTPSGSVMGSDKINRMIGGLTKQAMAAGKLGNVSEAVAKKQIITHFQRKWNELDQETRDTYNKQANKNESGFFVFVRKQTT